MNQFFIGWCLVIIPHLKIIAGSE